MKLLFVAPTDSLTGGGEISHYELIMAAKLRGHHIHVVVPAKGKFARKLSAAGINYSVVKYYWWGPFSRPQHAAANLSAPAKIHRLVTKLRSDCIITNSLNIPWGGLAAAMAGVPHIWLAREMPLYQYSYIEDHYDFFKKYSNHILANSKINAEYITRKTGRTTGHVYPYVDDRPLKLNNNISQTRLVNVGNIQPGKNQLELIKAAGILHKKGLLNTKVLLFGFQRDKQYSEKVQKTISISGLKKYVKISAFTVNPYDSIGPNDIFVQTSGYESFGRTTVEAMKLGLICVAADIPATREVMKMGGGSLYKFGNPKDLANKLAAILKDPQTYKTESLAAQKRALKNLSESACHEPFFEALMEVEGQKNKRSELHSLLPQFDNLNTAIRIYEKKIDQYQMATKRLRRDIDNIVSSKAYKTALILRRIFGR